MSDMVRLRKAAARYDVSVDTLRRWAAAGLIGRSRIGRVVFVSAADIERLIAAQRQPVAAVRAYQPAPAAEDWRRDELWRGAL